MKKSIIIIALLLSFSAGGYAQTRIFEGSLQEALDSARIQGKKVVTMISTTWCGPCHMALNTLLPMKEVGDFMNSHFILKHYDVDKADPDSLSKRFSIGAYPTFVIVNPDGTEWTRIVGAEQKAEDFIAKFENAMKHPLSEVKALYQQNPDKYGLQYAKALIDVYDKQGNKILMDAFPKMPFSEQFDSSNINLYRSAVADTKNVIVKTMLDKRSEVEPLWGKDYLSYIHRLIRNEFISASREKSADLLSEIDYIKGFVHDYPFAGNSFTKFVVSHRALYASGDIDKLIQELNSAIDRKKYELPAQINALYLSLRMIATARKTIGKYQDSLLKIMDRLKEVNKQNQYLMQ